MLTNTAPTWNVDDLTSTGTLARIRYREVYRRQLDSQNADEQAIAVIDPGEVVFVCLSLALFIAVFLVAMMQFFG